MPRYRRGFEQKETKGSKKRERGAENGLFSRRWHDERTGYRGDEEDIEQKESKVAKKIGNDQKRLVLPKIANVA
jgi:hypothetical protein